MLIIILLAFVSFGRGSHLHCAGSKGHSVSQKGSSPEGRRVRGSWGWHVGEEALEPTGEPPLIDSCLLVHSFSWAFFLILVLARERLVHGAASHGSGLVRCGRLLAPSPARPGGRLPAPSLAWSGVAASRRCLQLGSAWLPSGAASCSARCGRRHHCAPMHAPMAG